MTTQGPGSPAFALALLIRPGHPVAVRPRGLVRSAHCTHSCAWNRGTLTDRILKWVRRLYALQVWDLDRRSTIKAEADVRSASGFRLINNTWNPMLKGSFERAAWRDHGAQGGRCEQVISVDRELIIRVGGRETAAHEIVRRERVEIHQRVSVAVPLPRP